jgi:hypothetical protein
MVVLRPMDFIHRHIKSLTSVSISIRGSKRALPLKSAARDRHAERWQSEAHVASSRVLPWSADGQRNSQPNAQTICESSLTSIRDQHRVFHPRRRFPWREVPIFGRNAPFLTAKRLRAGLVGELFAHQSILSRSLAVASHDNTASVISLSTILWFVPRGECHACDRSVQSEGQFHNLPPRAAHTHCHRTCHRIVTATNNDGLPKGKPLICLVAGTCNPTQKRVRIR